MTRRDAVLLAGLGYIAHGWPVFILSSSKAPVANCDQCKAEHVTPQQMEMCRCLTCHGFYAATLDPGRLAEMVRLHPDGLLAIRTGAPSGTSVIDVDRNGIPAMHQMVADGLLPRTVAAATGGDGYHLFYAHPGVKISSGAGKVAPGIDSKSDRAYVVVAPSVHPRTRRPYRWLTSFTDDPAPLPQHWIDRLGEPLRRAPGPNGNALRNLGRLAAGMPRPRCAASWRSCWRCPALRAAGTMSSTAARSRSASSPPGARSTRTGHSPCSRRPASASGCVPERSG